MTLRVLRPAAKTTTSTDATLLDRIAEGDLGALGDLYDRYAPALLAFIARHAPREDAEDIVQTAFLRMISLAPSFEQAAASAKPWLFGIALRIVRERRRTFARLSRFLAELALRPRAPLIQADGGRLDLERAVARLTAAKRAVLLLAEVEGFSCSEIAAILEIPVGTVWTRLHHARRELRRHFQEAP